MTGFPAAAREALAERAAAPQPRQGDDDDPRQARCARSPSCPTGRRCATPARRSRRARWRRCPSSSSASRRRCTRAGGTVHWARDGAEANAIVAGDRPRARRARGDQGQVARHRRDRAERGAGGRGHRRDRDRPRGADHPARARQVVAHPRAGDPPQPGGDQARCSSARSRGAQDLGLARRRRSPRPRAGTCARSSSRSGWRSRARTSASRRPGPMAVVESEGNGRMCTTLPERAGHGDGDREGAAGVARPRGLPAAAAALVDRRSG